MNHFFLTTKIKDNENLYQNLKKVKKKKNTIDN